MPEMKYSGIEWLGKIPVNWKVIPLKHLFKIEKRIAGQEGLTVLSITQKGIKPKNIESNEGQLAESYKNYQLIYPNEFGMNHMDLLTGWVDISKFTGVISPDYRVFVAKSEEIDKRYYLHVFQLCYYQKIFYGLGQGAAFMGRWRLPANNFLNFKLPLPPLEEQRTIATYLDSEVAKIDVLCKNIEERITALDEYRKSVITEVVTQGLNSNVEMKDSEIDWIGKIPKCWEVPKLKYILSLINGRAYKDSEFEEDGKYKVLRVGNLFTNPKWYYSNMELSENKYCDHGDLLYSWSTSYGPSIWNGNKVIYHYHIWKVELTDKIIKKYAYYALYALTDALREKAHGTTMGFITMDSMYNSSIPLPSLKEQKIISDYLDKKSKAVELVKVSLSNQLNILQNYKKSLIYEYVTGKKQIPFEFRKEESHE